MWNRLGLHISGKKIQKPLVEFTEVTECPYSWEYCWLVLYCTKWGL